MNARTSTLRQESLDAKPSISPERAILVTEFYQANEGRYSVPVMRAQSLLAPLRAQDDLPRRGRTDRRRARAAPKSVPTFPELTCHSLEDLRNSQFAAQDLVSRG